MSETEWLRIFSKNLVSILSESRINQKELAEMTGLSTATISKYVNGIQMPTVRAIINISYALHISVDELIDFGDRIEY